MSGVPVLSITAASSPGAREEMNIDNLILSIEEENSKNMGREKPVKAGPIRRIPLERAQRPRRKF